MYDQNPFHFFPRRNPGWENCSIQWNPFMSLLPKLKPCWVAGEDFLAAASWSAATMRGHFVTSRQLTSNKPLIRVIETKTHRNLLKGLYNSSALAAHPNVPLSVPTSPIPFDPASGYIKWLYGHFPPGYLAPSGVSISTDDWRNASATLLREVGYFFLRRRSS